MAPCAPWLGKTASAHRQTPAGNAGNADPHPLSDIDQQSRTHAITPATIPIAAPTRSNPHRPSLANRDFLPWRFSDAGNPARRLIPRVSRRPRNLHMNRHSVRNELLVPASVQSATVGSAGILRPAFWRPSIQVLNTGRSVSGLSGE